MVVEKGRHCFYSCPRVENVLLKHAILSLDVHLSFLTLSLATTQKSLLKEGSPKIIKLRRPRQHTLTHAYTDTVSVPGMCVCVRVWAWCVGRDTTAADDRFYEWCSPGHIAGWHIGVSHFRRLNGLKFFFYIADWQIQGREKGKR